MNGIKNLFLAGQWLIPYAGLLIATAGKFLIQRICHKKNLICFNIYFNAKKIKDGRIHLG